MESLIRAKTPLKQGQMLGNEITGDCRQEARENEGGTVIRW